MKILIISSSLDPASKSESIAALCLDELLRCQTDAKLISLKDYDIPNFDNDRIYHSAAYQALHTAVLDADGLVFASPVYNWGCCAELKKFIEYVGSTPPDHSLHGAFYDKVITFVNAAGLPHSYMAFNAMAMSMMMDYKCIINPYNVYVHGRHWATMGDGERLIDEAMERIQKSMAAMVELTTLLQDRTYSSTWEI